MRRKTHINIFIHAFYSSAMGRSKSNASLKSNLPVPIPHDGPMFEYLRDEKQTSSSVEPTVEIVLNLCKINNEEILSLEENLVWDLKNATTTKQQIQFLQAYKYKIREKLSTTTSRVLDATDLGLCQLLLEWSVSYQTPVPLRRAVQSLFSLENDEIKEISKKVLISLWDNSKTWEKVLVSLETALNSPIFKPVLQGELLIDSLLFLNRDFVSDQSCSTGLQVAEILKLQLENHSDAIPHALEFQKFILSLFALPTLPIDGYNTLGIVYGRLFFCSNLSNSQTLAETAVHQVQVVDKVNSQLSCLARLQMVKGIAATLDFDALLDSNTTTNRSPLTSCWQYVLHVCNVATDPMVRWAGLKGLSTLASRLNSHQQIESKYNDLVHETMDVVLQAWENPPLRKLGAAIPGLFESLVKLIKDPQDLEELVKKILQQPANRKGKYLALDILLPFIPANQRSFEFELLLEGVGDRGSNTGPIADLWKKLVLHLWEQVNETASSEEGALKTWKSRWIPYLAEALVIQASLTRRKQVAVFCLPRIGDMMKKSKTLNLHLSSVYVDLLQAISSLRCINTKAVAINFSESLDDRVLWAQLEVARHTSLQKVTTPEIQSAISCHLPKRKIRVALTHDIASIRLVAFQSLNAIISEWNESIESEADMWRFAFPFVAKSTESKEYTSNMLQSLTSFLDRYSQSGSSNFYSFCVDFLLNDIIVKRGAYPGTIADKEGFILSSLGCILSFVTQNQSFSTDNTVVKNGVIFKRRRSVEEKDMMFKILHALFHREIFGSLLSLLFSIWDHTRVQAYRFLSTLVVAGQMHSISLPVEFFSDEARPSLKRRGVYLASSPRQREADTGSRILALLYYSLDDEIRRGEYMKSLISLLTSRLQSMKDQLRIILQGDAKDESGARDARDLPLAHGIIQAITLAVEHTKIEMFHLPKHSDTGYYNMYDELLDTLCHGIQISLAVVADIREGETVEGLSKEMDFCSEARRSKDHNSSVPLNVNTGTIGANGTFSSVSSSDKEEIRGRLGVQRVVIGSWLLTKETCAAIASIVSVDKYQAPFETMEKIGALLISTLTTLKHAGAAFAARDSLQEVVAVCLTSKTETFSLPEDWTKRLISEISMSEKVRDSTLRRSTGYALGFLAIMRSEVASKRGPTTICSSVLDELLTFSLPPEKEAEQEFEKLNLKDFGGDEKSSFFLSAGERRRFVLDENYETRCRVHALNVIRLIILDAPLASVIQPIVGDAIISAILGYNDSAWAVRNSATMVFAAAMLRVIDADKNASNSDRSSSNAITITELFRRYPLLSSFLPSVMKKCLKDEVGVGVANSQIFPILLLFSRIQAVKNSGEVAASLSKPFVSIIMQCLNSRNHAVRAAAARALANLCSEETQLTDMCNGLLVQSMSQKRDWNMVDGCLLTFEAAATAFPSFMTQSESITSTLLQIASFGRDARAPPSCVTTSIKTLTIILEHQEFKEDNELSTLTFAACRNIVDNRKFENVIGGSQLYASATSSFVRVVQQKLWKPDNETEFEESLNKLAQVFSSDLIDVRLAAGKTFKKHIYGKIDDLLEYGRANSSSSIPPSKLLSSVAKMILVSLHHELSRTHNTGSHSPTVRRLSRCFLECYYGYESVVESKSLFLDASDVDSVWSSALLVLEKDSLLNERQEECNGETYQSANAAEMMAIVVVMKLESCPNSESLEFLKKLEVFVRVISRLNISQASWRSRHSAALAIEKSYILKYLSESSFNKATKLCYPLVLEVLGMLQDFDVDVRASAVRAAYQLEKSPGLTSSQLPELILQETYMKVHNGKMQMESPGNQRSSLERSLLKNCDGIYEAMRSFDEEARRSRNSQLTDSSLLNITSLRKIFEQEEPNSFNEKALTNQLAIRSLLAVQGDLGESTTSKEILQLCSKCLDLILQNFNIGGIAHEITRFPLVFPSLHGILLSATAILFMGTSDDESNVKSVARNITEKAKAVDEVYIHPEILFALETLMRAQPGCLQTKDYIHKNSFLLTDTA